MSDSDLCPHDNDYRAAMDNLPAWRIRVQRSGSHLNEARYNDIDMTHPNWGMYICDRPGMYLERAGKRHAVRADAITLIPPWVSYHYVFPKNKTSGHAYLHVEIPHISVGLIRSKFQDLYTVTDAHCVALMWRWARRFSLQTNDPRLLSLEAQSVVTQILTEFVLSLDPELQQYISNADHFSERLRPAIDYINQHLHEPIAVSDLARLLGCSREHCIRLFSSIIKQTPTQYILSQRVERAADSLLRGESGIDQIALACGFPNRRYMSRVFKSHMGLTPAQYRGNHA